MKGKTGKYAKAPLAYVIAQVRFSSYLKMSEKIPQLQDALMQKYPGFSQTTMSGFLFGNNQIQPANDSRWDFTNIDHNSGIIINSAAISYHTTNYDTSAKFFEEFKHVLDIFSKIIPHLLVERIGLRYVDLIIPSIGYSPSDYVTEGMRGTQIINSSKKYRSSFVTQIMLEKGFMNFNFHKVPGLKNLPEDLHPINLVSNHLIEKISKSADDDELGILDSDRFIEERIPFDAKTLSAKFAVMHQDTSEAFRNIISPHAKKEWK